MTTLLHCGDAARGDLWRAVLPDMVPGLTVRHWPDLGDPSDIEYVAAWTLPPGLAAGLPNLRMVASIGAGVDQLELATIPPHVAVVRLIEPDLVRGMVEYAVMATLMLQRDMLGYRDDQQARRWSPRRRVAAADRRVGVMGLGAIGTAVLEGLAPFGFALSGWSRSAKTIDGVATWHGADQIAAFARDVDILICALPLTDETRGILAKPLFDVLPEGAGLINVGRGGHLVQDDLLAALATGQIGGAILDVTTPEPLPGDSALWHHPAVVLTPHIASDTVPSAAARAMADAILAIQRGDVPVGQIDRTNGY